MLMMLFFVIVFFMFLCLLGYPYEVMEFIKKNWKNVFLILSLLINVILIIWISVINKSNPEAEFKIKHYDVLIKQQDSIVKESIKLQKQLAEKGDDYIDTVIIYQKIISKEEDSVDKIKKKKNEEVSNINNLTIDSINRLFTREADRYINSEN